MLVFSLKNKTYFVVLFLVEFVAEFGEEGLVQVLLLDNLLSNVVPESDLNLGRLSLLLDGDRGGLIFGPVLVPAGGVGLDHFSIFVLFDLVVDDQLGLLLLLVGEESGFGCIVLGLGVRGSSIENARMRKFFVLPHHHGSRRG